jgi:hypothetical protein
MTQAMIQAIQQIVALRAQRDALASVVVIALARLHDGNTLEEYGVEAQLQAVGLIEATDWEGRAHRLSNFGREAMEGSGADGEMLDNWFQCS